MLKQVLVLEARSDLRGLWERLLISKMEIIFAANAIEVEELFNDNKDIFAIVVTATNANSLLAQPGDSFLPEVESLVKKIRETFSGPLVVASSLPHTQTTLMNAGCNHYCEKTDLFKKLPEILGL